jgi:ABC-type antimicrobial peptide transport system permease subunit
MILGAAAGLAGSVLVGRSLSSLLFATATADVSTMVCVVVVVVIASALAGIIPCRRALNIDPVDALRGD